MKPYHLLLFLFVLSSTASYSQSTHRDSVKCLLHIRVPDSVLRRTASRGLGVGGYRPSGFVLNIDSGGFKWQSDFLYPIGRDSNGYMVKVKLPKVILNSHPMLNCSALFDSWSSTRQFDTLKYGGVNTNEIMLSLISVPDKVKVYIICNRVWDDNGNEQYWMQHWSELKDYAAFDGVTEDLCGIDLTNFKIVFISGNRYILKSHITKPITTEPNQKETADFVHGDSKKLPTTDPNH